MDDLKTLLFHGLNETIQEAAKLQVLEAPYGRPPQITIEALDEKMNRESDSEDDENDANNNPDDETDYDDESDSDEEVQFNYEYGFNPLTFLGQFLKRNNPKNIAITQQMRKDAIGFLQKRASHGIFQEQTKANLELLSARLVTGIDLGPSVGMVTAQVRPNHTTPHHTTPHHTTPHHTTPHHTTPHHTTPHHTNN